VWPPRNYATTWPFDFPQVISYRCSIGTYTLSPRDFVILRLKCILVTVLTFLGHVTSSVTWSFFPRYAVSYMCSIDTNQLPWAVCEILSLNGPVVHLKNFKRSCMGEQSTPRFIGEYIPQKWIKQQTFYITLYSKSSQMQLCLKVRNRALIHRDLCKKTVQFIETL